jgi:bleomycin hydrolase
MGGIMKPRIIFLILLLILLAPILSNAQTKKKKDNLEFEIIKQVKALPVKNQGRTNTSWAFAGMSFIESELIRLGKGEHNLSPLFNVRLMYLFKAENFIRHQGGAFFESGGQASDIFSVIKNFGLIPFDIFSGKKSGDEIYSHDEMDAVLADLLKIVIKNKGGKIFTGWKDNFESIMNIYLGTPPNGFSYQDKKYTPKSFADSMNICSDDYMAVTSYSHHPFYTKFILEIPVNITNTFYYNVALNDLVNIIDNALDKGYSVLWEGDATEKSFDKKKCIAALLTDEELELTVPERLLKEKVVTQEMRQQSFDDQTSTLDHNMHIVGIAKDQGGNKFYYTKNSYGDGDKKFGGYWYLSEAYVRLKTIAIVIHKSALPDYLKEKLKPVF